MWRTMLVDDEEYVRAELAALFPWQRYGFQLTGEADNAGTALDMMTRNQPDLVITDIRMPEMDGLTFIARLKEVHPETVVAVVSAYNDFPYVREALRLGAVDYLMKAEATVETSGAFLERIGGVLERRHSSRRQQEELSGNMARFHRLATESLWRDLLTRASNAAEIKTRAHELGMVTDRNRYGLILIHISRFSARNNEDQKALTAELEGRIRSGWDWDWNWELIDLKCGDFVVVACQNCVAPPADGVVKFPEIAVCLAGGIYTTCASSKPCLFSDLPGTFKELREINLLRLYHREGQYLQGGDLVKLRRVLPPKITELLAAWERALIRGDVEGIRDFLAPIFQTVIPESFRPAEARWLVLDFINTLRRVSLERQVRWEEDNGKADLPELLEEAESIRDWQARIEALAFRYLHSAGAGGSPPISITLRKALTYIHAYYTRDLSLEEVAGQAGVSKSHLCRVFPEYTGEHFSDYLQRLRIERAKELLRFTNDHIYEIASRVGFWNSRYFSKVFHEAVGMTPADYRRHPPV